MEHHVYLLGAVTTLAGVIVKLYFAQQAQDQRLLDVTEKRAVLDGRVAQLGEENRRLRSQLARCSESEVGLVVIDSGGTIHSCSSSIEAILGWKSREVVGKTVDMLLPEEIKAKRHEYFDQFLTMSATLPTWSWTADILDRDGQGVEVAVSVGILERVGDMFRAHVVVRRID